MAVLRTASRALVSAGALAAAALFVAPDDAVGFSLLGHSLDLSQRSVRVFDNFPLTVTDGDGSEHPNFPGHDGAAVAIWKSAIEWGSTLHGDGNGDPSQPGDLGSGGANFDPTFQGHATGIGAIGDNTHSSTNVGGAVVAFTEFGPAGWRIRYNNALTWYLGPGNSVPGGAFDLQGVATREYGFALGLGHSSVSNATMVSTGLPGTSLRSIEADDAAGVQAIYGALAPTKPRIHAAFLTANVLSIHGENFDAFGNEVWFTREGSSSDGEPVKVAGATSVGGGTLINVVVPAEAGPGDVLVKTQGSSHADLSNATPFDDGEAVCGTSGYALAVGGANTARLGGAAAPVLGSAVELDVEDLGPSASGLIVFSSGPAFVSLLGGTLLVNPGSVLATLPVALTGGAGSVELTLPSEPGLAGVSVWSQAAAPDGGAPQGWTFTQGLRITFCE